MAYAGHGEMIPIGCDGFSARVAYAPTIRSSAPGRVAVSVEATDEVPAILMSECDGYVLGGHFKLVDHVPAREVGGG